VAKLEDIEAIRVSRNDLINLLSMPDSHLEEMVTDAFARVVDKTRKYRMCQIVKVTKTR
jgi:hypothetical protein